MRLLGNLAGLASLYVVQGVIAGIGVVLVQVAQASGSSLEAQAGLVAWGGLPWVLKLVWGVLLDRLLPPGRAGHKWVLFAAQLAVAAGVYAVAGRTSDMQAMATGWFALNVLASLQDVAADTFAIDAVEAPRRGLANAVMAGARAFGAGFLGSMLIARLMGTHGLDGAIHVLAGACAFAALPILATVADPRAPQAPVDWAELKRSWLDAPFIAGLGLAFVVLVGDAATGAVVWEFLTSHGGWTQQEALRTLLPWGATSELLGFALAAFLVDRVGQRRVVVWTSGLLGCVWLGFGAAPGLWADHRVVLALATIEGITRAGLMAGTYAVLMNASAPRLRATHFVVFMAMINLGRVAGPLVAPAVVAIGGFAALYTLAGAFQISVALGVRRWFDDGVRSSGLDHEHSVL